jgi:ATP-dependent DNA helicase RecG
VSEKTKQNWNILVQRENARIEWKENVGDERGVVKTLCAFANDIQQVGGGRVICGLKEDKNEYGEPMAVPVGLGEKRLNEIKNKVQGICHRNVEPPLTPAVEEHPVEEDPSRRILVFSVTASQYAHRYRIRKEGVQYYVRVNDRTQPADGLISRLLEQKKHWPPYLDQTHPGASLDVIDRLSLKEFLGKLVLPLPVESYLEPEARFRGDVRSLVTFPPGIPDHPVPRNFAILLFGREPHLFFRGAYTILSIYRGKDKAADRSQRYEIFGPIPVLIRELMSKLQLYMGIEIDKTADMLSGGQNRPMFSENAVKEAIVNAFVHRDYRSHEPVRVTVFIDRIEVANPGGLFNSISIEQLRQGKAYPSWRNPSLAWFMVVLEFAQNEGKGISIILEATRKIAGREPIFELIGNWFNVSIPAYVPYQEVETLRRPPLEEEGRDALLLVSIGGDSIEKQVKESLNTLGLADANIVTNFVSKDYVEGDEWEEVAKQLKKEIKQVVDSPEYERFHLFYRGPVVFPPLLGALISPAKRLSLYEYDNGRYIYTYTIDKRFLKG